MKNINNSNNNNESHFEPVNYTVYIDNYPKVYPESSLPMAAYFQWGPLATSSRYTKLLVDFLISKICTNIYA